MMFNTVDNIYKVSARDDVVSTYLTHVYKRIHCVENRFLLVHQFVLLPSDLVIALKNDLAHISCQPKQYEHIHQQHSQENQILLLFAQTKQYWLIYHWQQLQIYSQTTKNHHWNWFLHLFQHHH